MNERILSFLCTLLFFGFTAPAAQDVILDGDFESSSSSLWQGGTFVPTNSPFEHAYPLGHQAYLLQAGGQTQYHLPPQTSFFLSLDFNMKTTNGLWYVGLSSEDRGTKLIFAIGTDRTPFIGYGPGIYLYFTSNDRQLAALRTNTWYHLQLWVEVTNRTVEGFLLNTAGERVDFADVMRFPTPTLNNFFLERSSVEGPEADILFDNIALRPVSVSIDRLNPSSFRASWLGSTNFVLQSCTSLKLGPQWTNVSSNVTSVTNAFAGSARFYRLIR